jgi:hypothetical protein
LDFQISSASGSAIRRDAVSGDPTVNFVGAFGSATAATGNVLGFGFVTEFTFQLIAPPSTLPGDYTASGIVEQADLDLVLLNWGNAFSDVPAAWVSQRPTSDNVDQSELDSVLLHWGATSPVGAASIVAAIPEPSSLWLVCFAALGLVGCGWSRRRAA